MKVKYALWKLFRLSFKINYYTDISFVCYLKILCVWWLFTAATKI